MKKIASLMSSLNIDCVFLCSKNNIAYFTGFIGSLGYLLLFADKIKLFVDFRYINQAKMESKFYDGVEVIEISKGSLDIIKKTLLENHVQRVGFEDYYTTVADFEKIQHGFGKVEFVPIGLGIDKMRMIKNENEIAKIKCATKIVDNIFSLVCNKLENFETERSIAAMIEFEMKIQPSVTPSFSIVAYGEHSAYPHWNTSDSKIGNNGFLKMDFGCLYENYGSDITRTLYLGDKPTKKHIDIYKTVLEAQILAIEKAAAGVSTHELDSIARNFINSMGYGEYFGHGLGHGLGIGGGDLPTISHLAENTVLEENMVITIEPGIYIPKVGGVRIEDDVRITRYGCEVLTHASKSWMQISNN